jgi:hypothetical protein
VAVVAENSLHEAVERETCRVGISTWTFVNNNRHTSSSTISSNHISINIFCNAINPIEVQFRRISQELQRIRMNHWKKSTVQITGKANVKKKVQTS